MTAAHDTQALADIAAAKKILARLCDEGLVHMSIPVRSDDEDMVLSRVIALASRLQEQEGQPALSDEAIRRLFVKHGHIYAGWLELGRAIAALAAGSQAVQVPGWRPIDSAPTERTAMFVVRGFSVDSPRVGARNYTTDPYCVLPNGAGWWHRWPHTFPPTHWMAIPPLQPLAGGE